MSKSTFLEKSLDGAEVKWVPLGEIAEIKRGTSITKKKMTPGNIPGLRVAESQPIFT